MISITQNFGEGTSKATAEQAAQAAAKSIRGAIASGEESWHPTIAGKPFWTSQKSRLIDLVPVTEERAAEPTIEQIVGPYFGGPVTAQDLARQHDKTETAAWYGRGEKPEPTVDFEFQLIETSKPAKPGLFTVHGEGRYQGLGFNSEDAP